MPEREKPSPSPPPFSLSPLRRLGWRAGALRNGTTRGASFWGRPCLFGPASLETATRNFVTVSLLGSFLRGTPRAPAGKTLPAFATAPRKTYEKRALSRKTRRPFPPAGAGVLCGSVGAGGGPVGAGVLNGDLDLGDIVLVLLDHQLIDALFIGKTGQGQLVVPGIGQNGLVLGGKSLPGPW